MKRLKGIIAINNRISRIDLDLPKSLPNLESLILTNNQIQELGDLDVLSDMKNLKYLSLIDNPVVTKKYYRLFVINRCPNLRMLDFRKVKAAVSYLKSFIIKKIKIFCNNYILMIIFIIKKNNSNIIFLLLKYYNFY